MPLARINDHDMYYEVLGFGEPVLLMGGWGTFCHENHHHLPRGLTDSYQVVLFDYRGIRDSGGLPGLVRPLLPFAPDELADWLQLRYPDPRQAPPAAPGLLVIASRK